MKTNKELLKEILEQKEWGFKYHSENHEKAKNLSLATAENDDLKEIYNQAEKDLTYHYNKMIEEQNYILALESVL